MLKFTFYNAAVCKFPVVQTGPLEPLAMTVTEKEHTFFFNVGTINACFEISEELQGCG